MTGGTDWTGLASVIGAAGLGTLVGAVITTYGGRGRERREARSGALNCLEKIEIERRVHPVDTGAYYDRKAFTELCAKSMIAGIPRRVVSVYDHICRAGHRFSVPGKMHANSQAAQLSGSLAEEAARLLRDALWRPQLTVLTCQRRAWRLRRKAVRVYGEDFKPAHLLRETFRAWQKEESVVNTAHQQLERTPERSAGAAVEAATASEQPQ